jgi:hypothetical protein
MSTDGGCDARIALTEQGTGSRWEKEEAPCARATVFSGFWVHPRGAECQAAIAILQETFQTHGSEGGQRIFWKVVVWSYVVCAKLVPQMDLQNGDNPACLVAVDQGFAQSKASPKGMRRTKPQLSRSFLTAVVFPSVNQLKYLQHIC